MPPISPTPQLSNYLLHYTSREAAQDISTGGLLRPGRSGRLYLTPDLYPVGVDAADRLSIVDKAVSHAVLIEQPPAGQLAGPFVVAPILNPDGTYRRHGMGIEYYAASSISVTLQVEGWLVLNEP